MRELPVVDLARYEAQGAARAAFLDDLRRAAREAGFFYLVGHGVQGNDALLALARRFFDQPDAEKDAAAMIRSPQFRGYTRAGAELTRGAPDWREQFDVNSERAAVWRAGDPAWRRLIGPNLWPQNPAGLREAALGWQAEMTAAALRLLRAFAEALGQNPCAFDGLVGDEPNQHVKLIRYPGLGRGQGVGPHKDSGLLTFVLQDGVGGLEVGTADGGWIAATPVEGAFVVNIGEVLELASGGYLPATVHRVVGPPPGQDRLSAAFFLGPRHEAEAPRLVLPPELAREANGVSNDPDNPLLRHAGENYLKGRLRSHPDVAARHYHDL
ncbi:isopenicillin N synthase family dioxygenase [Methylocella sp.]|uniref:isopenicillin N synthase family dioxygenase n=1 Tax=Methylocella sp. TaxID=1978226 RepID=UPI00378342D1